MMAARCSKRNAALSGRILDDGRYPLRLFERQVYRLGNAREALVNRNLLQVAARVEVQQLQPQLLAALHLVEKSLPALLQPLGLRVSQVDEVAVVRQDMFGGKTILRAVLAKLLYTLLRQGCRLPLPLILGKESESLRSDGVCIYRGVLHATRGTYMSSNVFHIVVCFVISLYKYSERRAERQTEIKFRV